MGRTWILACLSAACLAFPAVAENAFLTAQEFEALTKGRVFATWQSDGVTLFGHEEFLPGRKVMWKYADGECLPGRWAFENGSVCYRYDGDDDPSCLRYTKDGSRIIGEQWGTDGPAGSRVVLSVSDDGPLNCVGGDIS